MELITPALGLIFWTTLTFVILFFLLKKMAWGPILNAVDEREVSITNALAEADKARQEILNIKSDNDKVLREARAQRDVLLKEAREIKENIITEAKEEAQAIADNSIKQTKIAIANEKESALIDLKHHMSELSIGITKKVLKDQLVDKDKQLQLIDELLKDITLN